MSYLNQRQAREAAREIVDASEVINSVEELKGRTQHLFQSFIEEITPQCSVLELQNILKIKSNVLSDYEDSVQIIDKVFRQELIKFTAKIEDQLKDKLQELYEAQDKIKDLEDSLEKVEKEKSELEREVEYLTKEKEELERI